MLVATLVLAAVGFGLLVAALATGSVLWAWGCIVVCVIGAGMLLVSALAMRGPDTPPPPAGRHARRDRTGRG
ncbi:hypothetical protein ACWEVD_23955 [Nocardia thailandica]|uniref:Integral membrane protein n=1 Tax=Nocardia thailandica TaxID=257275 RepID=A0ABW6PJ05_9NOCA|nr:hypothetical protein [Nocardia thailandica]